MSGGTSTDNFLTSSHNTTDLYITEEGPTPPLPNQISLGVWITIGMLSFIALSMLLYLINGLSLPRLSVEHSKSAKSSMNMSSTAPPSLSLSESNNPNTSGYVRTLTGSMGTIISVSSFKMRHNSLQNTYKEKDMFDCDVPPGSSPPGDRRRNSSRPSISNVSLDPQTLGTSPLEPPRIQFRSRRSSTPSTDHLSPAFQTGDIFPLHVGEGVDAISIVATPSSTVMHQHECVYEAMDVDDRQSITTNSDISSSLRCGSLPAVLKADQDLMNEELRLTDNLLYESSSGTVTPLADCYSAPCETGSVSVMGQSSGVYMNWLATPVEQKRRVSCSDMAASASRLSPTAMNSKRCAQSLRKGTTQF